MRKYTFEVICIGIPFSLFKIIMGQTLLSNSTVILGYVFIALGAIDLFINLTNLLSLSIFNKRIFKHCLLSYLVGLLLPLFPRLTHKGPKDMGVALDTLVSFTIVAIMIGCGWLKSLNSIQNIVWNWAVILNVLYAGVSRVIEASRRFNLASK